MVVLIHIMSGAGNIFSVIDNRVYKFDKETLQNIASLDLAYMASGRFDGFWKIGLGPRDVATGILMVREAGGIVKNYEGDEYIIGNDGIITSNTLIYRIFSSQILYK